MDSELWRRKDPEEVSSFCGPLESTWLFVFAMAHVQMYK